MSQLRNNRTIRLILKSISDLKLNLKGFIVLTEAGSNDYLLTPLIPYYAGASKIYVWIRDSSYGKADEIKKSFLSVCDSNNINLEKFEFALNSRPVEHLKNTDILTNSGFIRPINDELIQNLKPNAVIPLMYEKWELRDEDIDVRACYQRGIKIGGTWEGHPKVKVFEMCGMLAVKMAMNAGFEVSGNSIIVWSDDDFGKVISDAFMRNGALRVIQTTSVLELKSLLNEEFDFIFFCSYKEKRDIISRDSKSILNIEEIKEKCPNLCIIHLYGGFNEEICIKEGVHFYPRKRGHVSKMSFTLSELGPLPVIRLITAGFKVGEEMIKNNTSVLTQLI